MKQEARLLIERLSFNSNHKYYHMTRKLSDTWVHLFHFNKDCLDSEEKKFTTVGYNMLRKLLLIEGIAEVNAGDYKLSISKAEAFDWDAIDRAVISICEGLAGNEFLKIRRTTKFISQSLNDDGWDWGRDDED